MRYIKKYLSCEQDFLEVDIFDNDDLCQLSQYQNETNIIISMSNLHHLYAFTRVERLIITSGDAPDNLSQIIESQSNLRELKLDYDESEPFTKWCVDISRLNNLEYLFSRSSYNFRGIEGSKSLKTLIVHRWYNKDLSQLTGSSIDSLSIGCGNLNTLAGIEDVCLQVLSLSNLRNLTDVTSITGLPLKILELDNCNNISCFENISSPTLEYLMLYGKIRVQDVSFVKNYNAIKRVMLDIVIEDGDLSILDSLESAILLTDRRNFNRKNSQLPKASCKYTLPSIPNWRYIYSSRNI